MGAKESVVTSQGRDVGKLKAVEGELVHLEGKDYWLPVSAIETIEDRQVRLRPDFDYLGGPGKRGGSPVTKAIARLAVLGLIARGAMVYRDEHKRKDLMAKAKDLTEKAKTELHRAKHELEKVKARRGNGSMPAGTSYGWPPGGSGLAGGQPAQTQTPPFSTLDLSDRTVSARETEVILIVTQAFPAATVRADAIGVHKADGSEVGTVRFTVDERASADIELHRLETPAESAEVLAQEVIAELKRQLPEKGD